jgi:hypothetical protein
MSPAPTKLVEPSMDVRRSAVNRRVAGGLRSSGLLEGVAMGEEAESGTNASGPPVTFMGSARRIWGITAITDHAWAKVPLAVVAVMVIAVVWCLVTIVYIFWAIFVVPTRRLRSRRDRVEGRGAGNVKSSSIVN